MNIQFVVDKPIPRKKDTYVLHVKAMSGDADAYNTNKAAYKNKPKSLERLMLDVKILLSIAYLTWNEGCDEERVRQVVKETSALNGESLDDGGVFDWLHETFGMDVTCQGRFASLDTAWLTFFDNHGIEHSCKIEVDGQSYDKLYRELKNH